MHIRCNWLDKKDYKAFQDDQDKSFYCLLCMNDIMPYSKLNGIGFERISAKGENFSFTPLNYVPQSPIKQLMYDRINNWINDLNSKTLDDTIFTNETNCNYFTVDEFKDLTPDSSKSFSILHLNIHSLQLHIDEFRTFLDSANHKFDIIALSETKLENDPAVNIFLPGYRNHIHTFTEASKGGVCFYVSDDIDFKPMNDLKIYESKKIESLFI